MTFKDLKKWLCNLQEANTNNSDNQDSNESKESAELMLKRMQFDVFQNKPFWIEDIAVHKAEDKRTAGNCCFNHIIGLPKKDCKQLKIFDYEMQLVAAR